MNRKGCRLAKAAGELLRTFIASVVLGFTMMDAANGGEVRMGLFSVTLPVIAILHDDLFVGEAVGYLDRTGTIDLRSVLDPKIKCAGSFRYTGLKTGVADLQCDDGAEARLSFNALSAFSGYGAGSTPKGPASFTFGLNPKEAASHLTLPQGKKLIERIEGLRLESVNSSFRALANRQYRSLSHLTRVTAS
jgi:hypothetical protein